MSGIDDKSVHNTVLDAALEAAPFRLAIESADGREVYANHASPPTSASLAKRRFPVTAGDEAMSVVITFDDAEGELERAQLIQRAYFDDVTGLPNRLVAEKSVSALIAEDGTPFALALIGLDGFSAVNDFFGHGSGDVLLAKLTERIKGELRDTDLLARLRGDEFLLLLAPISSVSEARERLDHLLGRIRQPIFVDGREVFASASAGVSLYPDHGLDYATLQGNADRALTRGKAENRGSISIFDEAMQLQAMARGRIEQRLRQAILDHRILCAYQPKIDLRSGDVRGVEVLMRWLDEDGALQSPGEFLAVANEIGLIDQLTHLILGETIESIDMLSEAYGQGVSVSVNIAAKQAGNRAFMEGVVERLRATGFADRFMLEVTEDAFMATREFQQTILPAIRAVGARVSIDDFGTGYSSLSALADITADEIKIDRSFITDVHKRPRSQSVLKAIEALAHSLGMSITAEGVETFEELTYLQTMTRIQLGQGHYFAKAIPLKETVAERLEKRGRTPPPTRLARPGRM